MTFEELAEREPGLKGLERFAKRCNYGDQMEWVWSLVIKRHLGYMVGFGRPDNDTILGTPQAYQIAAKALRDALERGKDVY